MPRRVLRGSAGERPRHARFSPPAAARVSLEAFIIPLSTIIFAPLWIEREAGECACQHVCSAARCLMPSFALCANSVVLLYMYVYAVRVRGRNAAKVQRHVCVVFIW